MGATQMCGTCKSPLRPCKCDRVKKKPKKKRKPKAVVDAEFARKYHSQERREWVGWVRCCACGKRPTEKHPSENHHTWTEGTSRKGPYWSIVPLCMKCHTRYHQAGKLSTLQAVKPLRIWPALRYARALEFDQWEGAAAEVERQWRLGPTP